MISKEHIQKGRRTFPYIFQCGQWCGTGGRIHAGHICRIKSGHISCKTKRQKTSGAKRRVHKVSAKASKEGEEVLLSCVKGEGTVILSVSDWGIGMDEKTVRRATEAFYMADKSRSRKNGGAGLGLALCARIAEMHGAQLRIKSAPGQGTTVFLAFPETPPAEPEGGEST